MGGQEALVTPSACWQHAVRQREAAADQPPLLIHNTSGSDVVSISYQLAQEFIERYEWLGTVGAAKYCYGLVVNNALAGVVCFTTPASPTAFRALCSSVPRSGIYQLCRGASAHWAPPWAASRLISRSLRLMSSERGARLVVAYADPEAGEIGAVYQASNALYLGPTDSRGPGKYIILGTSYHARAVAKKFGCARHDVLVKVDPNYCRIQRTKKHRYVWVLGSKAERRCVTEALRRLIQSYPKRQDTPRPKADSTSRSA